MADTLGNLHSRLVVWAKIILPLIGLAILSSLFLFSKTSTPGDNAALVKDTIGSFATKERITAPRFAGMTPSGVAIVLSASEASPRANAPGIFTATDLNAAVEFPNGGSIKILAASGTVNSGTSKAELAGGITLETSNGYIAKTQGMTFGLDRLNIRSHGKITATGALGEITAGEMFVGLERPKNKGDKPGYVIVFKNRAKLVYRP